MPSAELYLTRSDGQVLRDWLVGESQAVRFVEDRSAQPELVGPPDVLQPGTYHLFHMSYPEVPVLSPSTEAERSLTRDLSRLMRLELGKQREGLLTTHPAIFSLTIGYESVTRGAEAIGLSSVGWIGARYESEGLVVTPGARAWWRRLRAWIGREGERVPRVGPLDQSSHGVWAFAFPHALARIRDGAERAGNIGD